MFSSDYDVCISPSQLPMLTSFSFQCSHIIRPENLNGSTDLMMFREGIQPMWEDEANARGGKLVLRLKKGLASHFWEEIVRLVVVESFM